MGKQAAESRESRNERHLSPLLRWALFFGVFVHLLGFFMVRISSDPLSSRQEDPAFITLATAASEGSTDELTAQASLFDSAPLFIPGEWSAASEVFSSRIVQDWRNFPDFEPSIELMDEVRPASLSLTRIQDMKQPSDFLNLRFWDLFSSFGEGEVQVEVFGNRNPVAVVTIMSGSEVYPADYEIRLEVDWQSGEFAERPVVFVINMSAPGFPMGAPLLKQSSGSDVVDAEVWEWLTRPATLAQLPAGFLELRVFP